MKGAQREIRVSIIFQASRGQRLIAWLGWSVLAGVLISLPHLAAAHDLFTNYVQHSVHLTVGASYCDLELDLTFFEEWSTRERAAMDADGNGRITRSEVESYVKRLAPELARQVKLGVAGRELALVPLYAPEVDLLGSDRVGPAHHRLRLFFFVPTPTPLHADDEIVVEDLLWPEARALGVLEAEGRDDCVLEIGRASGTGLEPTRPGEARLFKVRCLKPPKAKPDLPVVSPAAPNRTTSHPPAD
jgi:hypothetical protein